MKLFYNNRGFSLAELIIVMAIFLIVMMVTAATFNTVGTHVSQQSKSAETQIEGIVGLEVFRADLEQAGFGLPWAFQSTPLSGYLEADVDSTVKPTTGYWPPGITVNSFNDATGNFPRAIQSADTLFNNDASHGAKYIVIKSTVAGTSATAKKWTNVAFANGGKTVRTWSSADRDFCAATNPCPGIANGSERVIVVKNALNTTPPTRQLMVGKTPIAAADGIFSTTFSNYSTLTQPHLDGDTFEVYGVDPDTNLRMPFNRADYYVMTPTKMPADCAPHTGVLYKSNINHSNGGLSLGTPLLDCVADMQIAYGLDTSGAGYINHYTVDSTEIPSAQAIRDELREIRVYILSQEGKKDITYTYPSQTITVGEQLKGALQGRVFDLKARIGSGWQNYRWKVYTIVVRPKNLIQ